MVKKAKKLKVELVRNRINVSITRTTYFFDVIAEGEISDLKLLKKKLKLDTMVIEKGIFGKPMIVLDTCDDFSSAKHLMRDYIWKINTEIKEWK